MSELVSIAVVLDEAGVSHSGLPVLERVKQLVRERDEGAKEIATLKESDTHAALGDLLARAEKAEARTALAEETTRRDQKVQSYLAERDRAKGALRQLKEDLRAMGRLQKLACDLVLGDVDSEDVAGEDGS